MEKREVLERYARGEMTARQAAEALGITLAEFYELWGRSDLELGEEWSEELGRELEEVKKRETKWSRGKGPCRMDASTSSSGGLKSL